MRLISKAKLREFWESHPQAKDPLNTWYQIVHRARWQTLDDIKTAFPSADYVGNGRTVFNISGNKYRIIVWWVNVVFFVRFVGTHAEYSKIRDVRQV